MKNRELWFFLFLLGTLLFNWPFLEIFNLSLPFYLFGVWALFIIVVRLFLAKNGARDSGDV
jgi:hypothetical protein